MNKPSHHPILGAIFSALFKIVVVLFGWAILPAMHRRLQEERQDPSNLLLDRDDFETLLALVRAKSDLLINNELFVIGDFQEMQRNDYEISVQVRSADGKMMVEIEWAEGAPQGSVSSPWSVGFPALSHTKSHKIKRIAAVDGSWSVGALPMSDELLAVMR